MSKIPVNQQAVADCRATIRFLQLRLKNPFAALAKSFDSLPDLKLAQVDFPLPILIGLVNPPFKIPRSLRPLEHLRKEEGTVKRTRAVMDFSMARS